MAVQAKKATLKQGKTLRETDQVVVRLPILVKLAELMIRFLLGAILSSAQVLGEAAPFGLAVVASSGPGAGGLAALLGVCFGALSARGFTEGLRYAAAAVLIFSVSFAFYDLKLFSKTWFMPVTAAFLSGCTGFVYLSAGRWTVTLAVLFVGELLLTAGAAYFYRIAFSAWKTQREDEEPAPQQEISTLILAGTLLISLFHLALPGGLSAGRLLTCLFVLTFAYLGGGGMGATLGLCGGIAMDLAAGGVPFCSMAYGFAGLLSGVFWKQGKLFCTLAFVLGNAMALLWTWSENISLIPLYEVFIVSVVFLLLPQKLLRRLAARMKHREAAEKTDRSRDYVQSKLAATADAFRTLANSLSSAFRVPKINGGNPASIFDSAANRVCPSCALRDTCWQRDYNATFLALNDALPAMVEHGRGVAADFPAQFRSRCLKFPAFLAASNEFLAAHLTRNQYEHRLQESRLGLCRQYGQMAEFLAVSSAEMSAELTPDTRRESALQQYLMGCDFVGDTAVFYTEAGLLHCQITGRGLDALTRSPHPAAIAKALGVSLQAPTLERTGKGTRIVFLQAPPLQALTGLAARQKSGETVSGDGGIFLLREDGVLYALLCDGMGTGAPAHAESALAIHLLGQFLDAGVGAEAALKTLNSALALRCEAEGGFTTVDLLQINLFRGEGTIFKYGAAPSYLLCGGKVTRLVGGALPAGLLTGDAADPDKLSFPVSAGDCVVLLSDGVYTEEDLWLRQLLTREPPSDPKALAEALVQRVEPEADHDDKTALVVFLQGK
ncbi:MAG: SpoIIE family protein phosphatase [Oscillospiraceae bacterium]